ncbi:MAG TPA: radical SAM family heme chaperone HemW [Solirubrobacteraceae bacterium]|jgi:oxygen-independent coproporphyrinogen-3 oxidase|nr:radical SAM family heme chaperone HemW [Solirubrobacteraceae bacterium]
MGDREPPFGVYIHVPFCAARCGYCDFNTYVPEGRGQQHEFVDAALLELRRAHAELGERPVSTVFIGGGTPTLLGAKALLRLLAGVADTFGLDAEAEVTTEANPESVDPEMLLALRRGGFTRVSLGMQSAAPHVLRTLDRVHTPGRAVAAAIEAREAGFRHVSLDLIYGTPGETDADWERTLDAALSAEPDHVSAYGLIVEPGTALAAAVRRGTMRAPEDGDQARRFRRADQRLQAAGLDWYELCSWAASEEAHCRHNIGYWRSHDWWGIGPGAHSHVGGVRWWNVLRPADYAQRLREGHEPVAGREVLTAEERALEAVMLGLRLREGLALSSLTTAGALAAEDQAILGRVVIADGRVQLTREGRLFADAVARELSP